jgi:lipopolysaccharide transport system permease protein
MEPTSFNNPPASNNPEPARNNQLSPMVLAESYQGWGRIDFKEVWSYRHLFRTLVIRDIKSRYRMTAFGPLWFLIGPFFNMVVLSLVFGELAQFDSEGFPYPIFLFSATLPWSLFANSFERTQTCLLDYMKWISKVYIPHLILPIISVLTGLFEWGITLVILFGLMIFYQVPLSWNLLFLPIFMLFAILTALSFGLWSAPLQVRFRDFERLTGYAMTALYYATPIIYSAEIIPEKWLWLYRLNPMYWVVQGFRWSLLERGLQPQPYMLLPILFVIAVLIPGIFLFERASRNIVDIQ